MAIAIRKMKTSRGASIRGPSNDQVERPRRGAIYEVEQPPFGPDIAA